MWLLLAVECIYIRRQTLNLKALQGYKIKYWPLCIIFIFQEHKTACLEFWYVYTRKSPWHLKALKNFCDSERPDRILKSYPFMLRHKEILLEGDVEYWLRGDMMEFGVRNVKICRPMYSSFMYLYLLTLQAKGRKGQLWSSVQRCIHIHML